MTLAVIILNWNATDDTLRCVEAVRQWRLAGANAPPPVWVVDNGSSSPRFPELPPRLTGVQLLRSATNAGFAGGNNVALRAVATTDIDAVLLLNNDAMIDGADVESLMRTLASDSRIGLVGPTLWHGRQLLSAGGRDIGFHLVTHLRPQILPNAPFDVEYVPGTVVMIRREVFSTVGLLDEDFFFSGELADLCHRARQAGFRSVIDPLVRADHDLDRSSAQRRTLHAYYVMRNRFLFVRKHHSGRAWILVGRWCLRGLVAMAAALLNGQTARAWALGLGVLDGVRGRFGGPVARTFE